MTDELFEKAYEIKSKLWDLEKTKGRIDKTKLITFDTLPFAFSNVNVGDMNKEVEEVSEELKTKFLSRIDDMIKELKKEFDAL